MDGDNIIVQLFNPNNFPIQNIRFVRYRVSLKIETHRIYFDYPNIYLYIQGAFFLYPQRCLFCKVQFAMQIKDLINSPPQTGPCLCFGIEQKPKAPQRAR